MIRKIQDNMYLDESYHKGRLRQIGFKDEQITNELMEVIFLITAIKRLLWQMK